MSFFIDGDATRVTELAIYVDRFQLRSERRTMGEHFWKIVVLYYLMAEKLWKCRIFFHESKMIGFFMEVFEKMCEDTESEIISISDGVLTVTIDKTDKEK